MIAHRVETTLQQDGKLMLDNLPFHAGEAVEIIILAAPLRTQEHQQRYPLRGTPIRYERPFEPVAHDEWGRSAMIILDTHIWVWWVHNAPELPDEYRAVIEQHEPSGLGVSAISCWEVAKLVEQGRLTLPCPIDEWLKQALAYPGIQLLPLTPEIAVVSTQLPPPFHRDPADQIIVATARIYHSSLVTMDTLIRAYPHVQLVP